MEFQYEKGRIYALDSAGKLIAEITFPEAGGIADIDHTFVDGALRGEGLRVRPTCSYAARWFSEHPEESDLL